MNRISVHPLKGTHMRNPNILRVAVRVAIGGTVSLLAAATVFAAAPVTVENTPLPVSGTVSATVTNKAANPVPITSSDRPTAYHASIVGQSNGALTPFPIPTGCRLVIQAASVVIVDTALHPHAILLTTGGATHFINLQQTADVGQFISFGTLPIQLYVDSGLGVSMGDEIANPAANPPTYSISGYLLSLTPGASC